MPLSMYDASIPDILRMLGNLDAILDKALAHAEAKKIDPSVFVNARLAPDMFPLSRQIQIATDVIKGGAARLAGIDVPSYPDTESTFAELKERIGKTVAFLGSVPRESFEGSESRAVTLKLGGEEKTFTGQAYLLGFVLPNVYFHLSMVYALLRHNGVDLGKKDFLRGI